MITDNDKPFVDEARTFAALANLDLTGMIEYDESGEGYLLTDQGLSRAYELLGAHSDEEKILLMNLFELMKYTQEQEKQP